MRTIDWDGNAVVALDQTLLPFEERFVVLDTVDALVDAIRRLAVRGAPALGVAGALGVVLACREAERSGAGREAAVAAVRRLREARPTAVNLAVGVDRALARLDGGTEAVLGEALALLEEDVAACRALAVRGADLLAGLHPGPLRLLTHCNAGALACVEWGTALGVIRELHERGLVAEVVATETRPLLQGARLTAWELARMGVPHRLVVDSAGASVLSGGLVDAAVVGADRIAANGDVANKIGTYPLALAADRSGVTFVVAAPETTIDVDTPNGAAIPVEDRDGDEVLGAGEGRIAPESTGAWNPAFDVTPAELVSAIVTECRVIHPQDGETPAGSGGGS